MANVEGVVQRRLEDGRRNHKRWRPLWAECMAFVEGRQFVYRSAHRIGQAPVLNELPTTEGGSKPQHRARTVRNFVKKFVVSEVSMGTQRVPGYEVTPTTTDPEDVAAAKLSEKILLYLYDQLGLRRYLVHAYMYAVVCGEGFIRPYWNPKAGDPLPDGDDGERLYTGELQLEALGPQEVFWQPEQRLEKSPWVVVEKARTIEEIRQIPGYNGADLKPDATSAGSFLQGTLTRRAANPDKILVSEYLELPSAGHDQGRRFYVANNQQITKAEDYPCLIRGEQGYEHAIRAVSYVPAPWRDRDMGLTEDLIDPQRTVNDSVNKAIGWKNLALVPRVLAPVNSVRDPMTDEPGAKVEYIPVAGMKPEFIPTPPIPSSLFEMCAQALQHMEEIASNRSVPTQVESGRGIAEFTERDLTVRGFIVQALADFHSGLGRHLLHYVQKYWTETRLVQVNGRRGIEYIEDFKGANLRDQVDVTVPAASIEPRTRAAVERKVFALVDRQLIPPEKALAALEGGYAENLLDDVELHAAKQQREINQMIALGTERLPGGEAMDAASFDRHDVHLDELHRWMVTEEYERQPDVVKTVAVAHEQQHRMLLSQQQAEDAAQQVRVAQSLGMANATRPADKPLPSAPGLNGSPQPVP